MQNKWWGILSLYLQGLVQGIGFTTIPAAANFLIAKEGFGLSTEEYGTLFVPMIIASIIVSFFGGVFAEHVGTKRLLLLAGVLNIAAMLLFASTAFFSFDNQSVYVVLLLTMTLLGAGFGANITALNPFVFSFFPEKGSIAVTALHTCLGIGTALGPLLWNGFMSHGKWWLDPLSIALAYFLLFIGAWLFLPTKTAIKDSESTQTTPSQPRIALIPLTIAAFLYGITETTFGNWTTIFLHEGKQLSQAFANQTLAIFWGAVTLGRLATTFLAAVISPKYIYRALPLIILAGLALISRIDGSQSAIIALAVAGLGCSAFLPLTISIGEKRFYADATFASGLLIATYMAGYGVAAQGIGLLHKNLDISWMHLFIGLGIPVALLLGLCIHNTKVDR